MNILTKYKLIVKEEVKFMSQHPYVKLQIYCFFLLHLFTLLLISHIVQITFYYLLSLQHSFPSPGPPFLLPPLPPSHLLLALLSGRLPLLPPPPISTGEEVSGRSVEPIPTNNTRVSETKQC